MCVRSDTTPCNVRAQSCRSRRAHTVRRAGSCWHASKPTLSGLSEHQPLGRYTPKLWGSPGTPRAEGATPGGDTAAPRSLGAACQVICCPVRDPRDSRGLTFPQEKPPPPSRAGLRLLLNLILVLVQTQAIWAGDCSGGRGPWREPGSNTVRTTPEGSSPVSPGTTARLPCV